MIPSCTLQASCLGRSAGLQATAYAGRRLYAKQARVMRSAAQSAAAEPQSVWALDFDGVVCDSCGESSLSAWKAASKVWPDVFQRQEVQQRKGDIVEKMRAVRPVVETGYENIVQIRCLVEGVSVEDMLSGWHTLLPKYMERWQLHRSELVDIFGSTRDDWIATDLEGWLAPNRMYPGVAQAVKGLMESQEVYIVTTKQARFTEMILQQMAGIEFPPDRIFSQTVSGRPKSEVLEMLQQKHQGAAAYHFVEDKLSTLEKVAKVESLRHWQLCLVDWGYNTVTERRSAQESERIEVVDISKFAALTAIHTS